MGRPTPYIGAPSEVNNFFCTEDYAARPTNAGRVDKLRGVFFKEYKPKRVSGNQTGVYKAPLYLYTHLTHTFIYYHTPVYLGENNGSNKE